MVSEKKIGLVADLVKLVKEYSIVGIVNMHSLPARQLQNMRAMLGSKGVKIIMARKKLLELVLNNSGLENIQELKAKIKGMPALILSKENPFVLYSVIQKNKSSAPAKAGQEAPRDIVVAAGATNFVPGPIISELAAVGIKTKVENGKLAIINDAVVAKEGDVISAKLAETLKRLDVQPMEVGLDLVSVWENGLVFDAKQLYIDEAEYEQNVISNAQEAFNLAVEIVYLTSETTEVILQKAAREAKTLAIEQNVVNDETKEEILAKAEAQANSVKSEGKIEVGAAPAKKEAPKEEPKVDEPKVEEPKEEPKVEEAPKEEPKVDEPKVDEPKVEEPKEEPKVEEAPKEEVKEEPKVEEPKEEPKVEEAPKEEPKVEEPKEEPKVEEAAKEEPKVEEPKEEPKVEEAKEPTFLDEKPEINVTEKQHPRQGDVSVNQAQELLGKLQKEGTLRDEEK
jgi:large subunit ribosomal protein L10